MFRYVLQIDEMEPRGFESGDHYLPTIVAAPSTAYERTASQLTSRWCSFKAGRRCKLAIFRRASEWRGRLAKNWLCFVKRGNHSQMEIVLNWLCSAKRPIRAARRREIGWFRQRSQRQTKVEALSQLAMFAMFGKSRNTTPPRKNWLCSANEPATVRSGLHSKLPMFRKSTEPRRSPNNWLCFAKSHPAPSQPSCKVEKDHAQPRSGDTRS